MPQASCRPVPSSCCLHSSPSAPARFIHLPLFNVLLGWPIQFLGLVVTP